VNHLALALALTALSAVQAQYASDFISKSTQAVGYQVGVGGSRVDLKGSDLMPQANGRATVEAKKGYTQIEADFRQLEQPTKFGVEFLTLVLWAISPEGRAINLGEVLTDKNGSGKLRVSTQMQAFSLVVTVEPYYAVRIPSELVVLENEIRKDTKGKIFVVDKYLLLKRGRYQKVANPLALGLDLKGQPLELYEARNAISVGRMNLADKYAGEIFTKAEASLQMAENQLNSKAERKQIISTSRQAVQFSQDALTLALQRQEDERINNEREAAAAKAKAEAEAKAAAEAAQAKAQADAEMAETKRRAEEEQRRQGELAAAREAQMKAEAEAAAVKAKVERDALKAKEEAAKAEAEGARRAAGALRAQLLEQFNRVLETRDTARGLVVNMGDVLFDVAKYDLRPFAREKLARLSGIVLAHSGLRLDVEGHTDSTGRDEFNDKLSEDRAEAVRSYLIDQGLPATNLTAKGLGPSMPVASNSTAEGRQKNRRVEIIVSGEVIGVEIGK